MLTGQSTTRVKALFFAAANAVATPKASSVTPSHVVQFFMDLPFVTTGAVRGGLETAAAVAGVRLVAWQARL